LARPSGRRLDRPSGLSLGIWAGPGVACRSQCRLLAELLLGSRSMRDPGFMNLTTCLITFELVTAQRWNQQVYLGCAQDVGNLEEIDQETA